MHCEAVQLAVEIKMVLMVLFIIDNTGKTVISW